MDSQNFVLFLKIAFRYVLRQSLNALIPEFQCIIHQEENLKIDARELETWSFLQTRFIENNIKFSEKMVSSTFFCDFCSTFDKHHVKFAFQHLWNILILKLPKKLEISDRQQLWRTIITFFIYSTHFIHHLMKLKGLHQKMYHSKAQYLFNDAASEMVNLMEQVNVFKWIDETGADEILNIRIMKDMMPCII